MSHDATLTACRSCGEQVAPDAQDCPHCGTEWPGSQGALVVQKTVTVVAALAILYFLVQLFGG